MSSWKSKGNVLPALSVRRDELRQSLRTTTIAWMYGVVWFSIITGDQMRCFAKMLGFNDFWFGVLGAVPFLATIGQLNAALIIERVGERKPLFLVTGAIHRLLWIFVAAIPLFLPIPSGWAISAVLIVLCVSYFLGAVATPAWLTWMGDLIPRRVRGRYFARRAQITQFVQVVAVIITSIVLDKVNKPDLPETPECQPVLLWTICGLFVVGALFGATDILLFRRVREVKTTVDPAMAAMDDEMPVEDKSIVQRTLWRYRMYLLAVKDMMFEPLKDHSFRQYVIYGATITFSATVSSMYFWRYTTEGLGFSKLGTNALFLVIGPLAGTFAANWWGRMQDRWGRRPVLLIATIGTVLSLLPWFFPTRQTPAPAFLVSALNWMSHTVGSLIDRPELTWVAPGTPVGAYLFSAMGCLIGGISWTGVGIAQTGIMLGFSDGQGRSKFVAASAVFINLGGAMGGLVGGAVAQMLEHFQRNPIRLGPFEWNNWHATFLLSVVVRTLSLVWLGRMPDPGARPVRHLLKYWKDSLYEAASGRLFMPLRIFGWGRDRQGEGEDRGRDGR